MSRWHCAPRIPLVISLLTASCVEKHPEWLGASSGTTVGTTGPGTESSAASGSEHGTSTSTGGTTLGGGSADDGTTSSTTGATTSGASGTDTTVGGTPDMPELPAVADTHVTRDQPDANFGAEESMSVDGKSASRPLLRVSRQAVMTAVGARSVDRAVLYLRITANDQNWTFARPVDLHRVETRWEELGATWSCADDSDTGNMTPDCSGMDVWDMGMQTPLSAQPIATAFVDDTMLDTWLAFDVTMEIQDIVAGTVGTDGWLIKKPNENVGGTISLATREHATQVLRPRLEIELGP